MILALSCSHGSQTPAPLESKASDEPTDCNHQGGPFVAFFSYYEPSYEIGLAAADGSCIQRLTNNNDADGFVETCHEPRGIFCPSLGATGLSWSPDSEHILFTSDRDGDADVYEMNRDGSNVRQLTDNSADDIVGDNVGRRAVTASFSPPTETATPRSIPCDRTVRSKRIFPAMKPEMSIRSGHQMGPA